MSPETVAVIVSSAAAVFGSITSVLLLSFRVGRLVGQVAGFMETSTADRQSLHAELGAVDSKLDRHIEQHARVARRGG